MNRHIFFRAFFWLIPRFSMIYVLLYFIPWIEWTPLPDLSIPLSYVYHAGVTYVFARLAYGRHLPTWRDAGVVSAIFVLFGTLLEMLYVMFKRQVSFVELALNFTWHSLAITLVYILFVFLAAWRVRFKQQREKKTALSTGTRS